MIKKTKRMFKKKFIIHLLHIYLCYTLLQYFYRMIQQFKLKFINSSDHDDIFRFWNNDFPESNYYDDTVPLNQFSNSLDVNEYLQMKNSSKPQPQEEGTATSLRDKEEVKDIEDNLERIELFQKQSLMDAEINADESEIFQSQKKPDLILQDSVIQKSTSSFISRGDKEPIQKKGKKVGGKKQKKNGDQYKRDSIKNMWGSTVKITLKAFHSLKYKKIADHICHKSNTTFFQVSKFYKPKMNELISLQQLRQFLDYNGVNSEYKAVNKAFNQFYVWFMRNKYTLHVVQSEDIQHKDIYLKEKNKLVYLPNIKINPKSRRLKNIQED